MHHFNYEEKLISCLTPEIVKLIGELREYKGKQDLFIDAHQDELVSLTQIAKIQSTSSSNRIEGIFTTDRRLNDLMAKKVEPHNRSEQEIAGYREVLNTIHEAYEHIRLSPGLILQLHRDLYAFSPASRGGQFKSADNFITEEDAFGNQRIRFTPVPAFQTAEAMQSMVEVFNHSLKNGRLDPLILIPAFILDFLCIHPFNDGNGRISRLLSLLLFYQSGFIVGKYLSFEMIIEKTKEDYYDSLEQSSLGWHENQNDYVPFLRYYLSVLSKAYEDFEDRVDYLKVRKLSKPDRIKAVIDRKIGKITKREIMELCPDISRITVERTLTQLVKEGKILKVGSASATAYIKNA